MADEDQDEQVELEFASNTPSWRKAADDTDNFREDLYGGTIEDASRIAKEFGAVILAWNREAGISKRVAPDGSVRDLRV